MKPVIIIAIAFVVLVSIPVFAQEESLSELKARLDAENLQKAQEAGSKVTASPIPQESLDCPKGTYHGLDNQGNPACRDQITNQIVDPNTGIMTDSQTGQIILQDDQMTYIGIGVVIFIIIIAIIAGLAKSGSKSDSYKDTPRRNFSSDDEEQTLKNQGNKCNDCQTPIGQVKSRIVYYDFDHIDGDHYNNSIENCQALCKNCHANKTESERGMDRD